jgi:hypothetical protein
MYGKTEAGVGLPVLVDSSGKLLTKRIGSPYYDNRRNIYLTANQTGCVWTVGLATTYTGLCLSNPLGSGKNLSLLGVSHQEVVAPTGIAAVYLAGLYHATAVTHTTPAAVTRASLGAAAVASVAKADTGATLPAAPTIMLNLTAGHTSGALSTSAAPAFIPLDGMITIEPGGFVIIANFTIGVAVGQQGAFIWEEIDE